MILPHFLVVSFLGYPVFIAGSTVIQISEQSGKIRSPNYPETYDNDLDISWRISADSGFKITLKFIAFDVEDSYEEDEGNCVYDFLEISENGQKKCKFCASSADENMNAPNLNGTVESVGNEMTVRFVSDYSNEHPMPRGFEFEYKIVDRDECREKELELMFAYEDWDEIIYCNHKCHNSLGSYRCSCDEGFQLHANGHTCTNICQGIVLTADNGEIATSRYPQEYSKLADCNWMIKGKEGVTIDIRFMDTFSLETHYEEGCVYDWLQYKLADGTQSDKLCGQTKPKDGDWIQTNSHEVEVIFHSDLTEEKAGFKLEYKFNRVLCKNKPIAPQHGSIKAPKSSYMFEDVVEFQCSKGYYIASGIKTVTCTKNGLWSGKTPLCEEIICSPASHIVNIPNGKNVPIFASPKYGHVVTAQCKEYFEITSGAASWICSDDAQWVPNSNVIALNTNNNIPECKPICGLKGNQKVLGRLRRRRSQAIQLEPTTWNVQAIVIGKPAKYGEWPWMAFVDLFGFGLGAGEFCGGSLISTRTVITAAHCTKRTFKSKIQVFIAASERNARNDIYVQRFGVSDLHEHPKYSQTTFDNDIAVLILDRPVNIGKYARPVCLPRSAREQALPDLALTDPDNHQKTGVIAGWGVTESGRQATELNFARIPPIDQTECRKMYNAAKSPGFEDMKITDNMLCAGDTSPTSKGRDSCQGDSGGPLMFKDKIRNTYFLHGIVSFGSTENCGKGTFGIYTRVTKFISWIENFIKD